MKTVELKYLGDLRIEAKHLQSQTTLLTDAPTDNEGKGEKFSPTDLVATALGCCMLTIMGITARKYSINIEHTQVEVTKIMAAEPRRIGEIVIEIHFPDISYTDKEKKLLEAAARNCPVAKSLHPELKQNIQFIYSI